MPDSGMPRGRQLRLLALLAAIVFVAAACGSDDDDALDGETPPDGGSGVEVTSALFQAAQTGGITIGIAEEPPFGFTDPDTGDANGEAPIVARAVLAQLGITDVSAEAVDFGALINGLAAGQYDIVAAGMFITEERASQALFTDPDYCVLQGLAVPDGNPDDLNSFADVAANSDVTLGVLGGAVEEGFALDAGVPDGQLSRFDAVSDMVDALTSGRIDSYALTAISVTEQTAELDGFEASEPFAIEGILNCGGYVFRVDDQDARDEFNAVLVAMRDGGDLAPLLTDFPIFEDSGSLAAAQGVSVMDIIGMPYDFAIS
ncbi:MAG TPA: ectoine/hydroxyectoine ABC transporter substrate-binding protein EhuB [Acidimicrobiales bacterium]